MKTNSKHFRLYRETARKWISVFGLTDWDVDFYHIEDEDCMSSCLGNSQAGSASLRFSKEWGEVPITDVEIRRTALHEVLELLLLKYRTEAMNRYSTEERIDTESHAVIQRLINVLNP